MSPGDLRAPLLAALARDAPGGRRAPALRISPESKALRWAGRDQVAAFNTEASLLRLAAKTRRLPARQVSA